MSYDPQTGKRIRTLDEKLRYMQYDRDYDKSSLESAKYTAGLTVRERFTTSVLFVTISGIVMTAAILTAVNGPAWFDFDKRATDGYVTIAAFAGIVLFFSLWVVGAQIEDHRGGAARSVQYAEGRLRASEARVAAVTSELEHEQKHAEEKAAAKRLKRMTEPGPVELLEVIVATASRNAAATESDALLWSVVAENPDDEDAWQAIADRNGWSADLMVKIKNVRASARGPRAASANAGAPAIAGWAG